jgi:hypothetical protein
MSKPSRTELAAIWPPTASAPEARKTPLIDANPQRQTAPGGRGVAVMLIRHPRFARGNDLYETSEVATLGLLAREPLSPTIWEIEADALRMPEGRQ